MPPASSSPSSPFPVRPLDPAVAPSVLSVGSAPGLYSREITPTSSSYTVDYSQLLDFSSWQAASSPGPPPVVPAPPAENGGVYVSPIVHHALVRDLKPGEVVFYRISGPGSNSSSLSPFSKGNTFSGQFRVPGGKFPLRLGIVADPGQTYNTSLTLDFLLSGGGAAGGGKKPDVLLMPGDLTYADNNGDFNMFYDWDQAKAITESVNTFSPRWDSFGRLLSRLAATVPILTAPGNHEVEQTPENARFPVQAAYRNDAYLTRFANYLARYPSPQTTQQVRREREREREKKKKKENREKKPTL
jgi:hypothetical protein